MSTENVIVMNYVDQMISTTIPVISTEEAPLRLFAMCGDASGIKGFANFNISVMLGEYNPETVMNSSNSTNSTKGYAEILSVASQMRLYADIVSNE
jgi:hypothetical protein